MSDDHTRRRFLTAAGGLAALAATSSGATALPRVDPTLRDASGETTVVVRLERAPPPDDPHGGGDDAVAALRDHAERTQRAVLNRLADVDGVAVDRRFWLANAVVATVDVDVVSPEDLAALEHVERLHGPDVVAGTTGHRRDGEPAAASTGDDAAAPGTDGDVSWAVDLVNAPAVWERHGTRGAGASVCVVDTGADPDHPDVDVERWAEFDERGRPVDSEPTDYGQGVGHGTAMSSVATGGDESGTQIGVAPDADLYVAAMGAEYNFPGVMAGLEWAVENDADVASLSLTMEGRWGETIEPMANAVAAGTLPVTPVEYPAPFLFNATTPAMLVTAPLTRDLVPRQGKNGGAVRWGRTLAGFDVPEDWPERSFLPDLSLAGTEIPTAVSGPQFPDSDWSDRGRGASFTPPVAAGVVALLVAGADDPPSPAAIRETLRATASKPDDASDPLPNDRVGHGIPDAAAALARHVDPERTVTGTVTDDAGDPVDGATVAAYSGAETTTGADGSFSLSVPPGAETLTVDALGYEVLERSVPADASAAEVTVGTRIEPELAVRDPLSAHLVPGETHEATFDVAHADAARVLLDTRGPGRAVDPDAFDLTVDGTASAPRAVVSLDPAADELRVAVTPAEDARGRVAVAVEVANTDGEVTGDAWTRDPVSVHRRPLRVSDDEDLRVALSAAAPDTTVELAGDEWTVATEPVGQPFHESLLDYRPTAAVLEPARDDAAALVVDRPLTLTAADGHDPTITVRDEADAERSVGLRVAASYVTVEGVEIDAGGALAGVGVLNGVGVTVADVAVSNARTGILGELTMSLLARSNDLRATDAGIRLSWIGWNARLADNAVRGASEGVVLDAGFFIDRAVLDRNRFVDVDTEVATRGDGSVSYERTERDESADGDEPTTTTTAPPSTTTARPTAAPTTAAPTDRPTTPAGTDAATTADPTREATTGDDGGGSPGFGVAGAVGGVAALAHLLRRRGSDDDEG